MQPDPSRRSPLAAALIDDLRRMNPWWEGKPMPVLPTTRRHLVGEIHGRLERRLAPAVVVRGPRQIGKTTAQLHVLQDLLGRGVPPTHVFRVQADELPGLAELPEPILRLVDWYEEAVLGDTLNGAAHKGRPAYLFFDEVQNLSDWAPQLKFLVDHSTTQVVVTGSSALRIELGRDSLAGRITTIEAGVLSLTEIAAFRGLGLGARFLPANGLEQLTKIEFWHELREHGRMVQLLRDEAFRAFSERGGYPLAHQHPDLAWHDVAAQLNETVIRRVIRHDLGAGRGGRRRNALLLEELFRLACRYVGQAPGSQLLAREAERALQTVVTPQQALRYLRLLDDTLLIRLVRPIEMRLGRSRGNDKICLCDHALRASWLQEVVPLDPAALANEPHLLPLAGRLAESVTGATLATISSLDLAHLPARSGQPEVDFVLTIGTRRVPVEVKYQRQLDPLADTEGLRTFLERTVNNAPFGILVTQADTGAVADPRIVSLPLSTLMLLR